MTLWTSTIAPMLTTNIYTGSPLRRRQTFTGWQLCGLWCFLYVVLDATPLITLSTDTCNLEFQCISLPSELLTISGATAPLGKLQALPPATAQAILARESISRKDPHKVAIICFSSSRCSIQVCVWGQPMTIPERRGRLMGTLNALVLLFLDPGGP